MKATYTARNDAAMLRWRDEQPADFEARFLANLDPSGDCTIWTGGLSGSGYGRVRLPQSLGVLDRWGFGQNVLAHRVSWVTTRGLIPAGMFLDHGDPAVGCRTRSCVNPAHLAVTTPRGNVMTGVEQPCAVNAAKIRCIRGREFDEVRTKAGRRTCSTCVSLRAARRDQLIREAAAALGISGNAYVKQYGQSTVTARTVLEGRTNP